MEEGYAWQSGTPQLAIRFSGIAVSNYPPEVGRSWRRPYQCDNFRWPSPRRYALCVMPVKHFNFVSKCFFFMELPRQFSDQLLFSGMKLHIGWSKFRVLRIECTQIKLQLEVNSIYLYLDGAFCSPSEICKNHWLSWYLSCNILCVPVSVLYHHCNWKNFSSGWSVKQRTNEQAHHLEKEWT